MTEIQKELLRLILQKYEGKALLCPKETAEITGRSVQSLQRDRNAGVGITYKKADSAIVEYLSHNLVVTK
jgi:hypothetical protein